MLTEILQLLGTSLILVMGMMIVLWAIYMVQKFASILDIGWALGFVFCGIVYFSMGEGYWMRRGLITFMVLVWGLRLAWHLLRRFIVSPEEDPRYQEIKKLWNSKKPDRQFLLFAIIQGLLVVLLSLPFLLANINRSTDLSLWEPLGFLFWLVGLLGESLADWQLWQFKKDPTNRDKVCQMGLWHYSRHPNYFFECVIWIGFFLFALGSPWGWLTIYCPLVIFYLILKVTGIPLAEAQALRTKGDEYREYQRTTNMFIPWFKEKS